MKSLGTLGDATHCTSEAITANPLKIPEDSVLKCSHPEFLGCEMKVDTREEQGGEFRRKLALKPNYSFNLLSHGKLHDMNIQFQNY